MKAIEILLFETMCFFCPNFYLRKMLLCFFGDVHPGRLPWNLQITHLERNMIFQTSIIVFHVNLPGWTVFVAKHTNPQWGFSQPKPGSVGWLKVENGCFSSPRQFRFFLLAFVLCCGHYSPENWHGTETNGALEDDFPLQAGDFQVPC